MEIRDLRPLTLVVSAMVVIDALMVPAILGWGALFPESFAAHVAPVADAIDGMTILLKFATYFAFGVWIYRAGNNLLAAGFADLAFTPASRIWWFAVPFANLVKPYQGMLELWNASHGESDYTIGHALVGVWWALWLANGMLALIVLRGAGPDSGTGPLWLQSAGDVAVAIVGLALIRRIAQAQTNLASGELIEVFS
jgi:hypothetical protein